MRRFITCAWFVAVSSVLACGSSHPGSGASETPGDDAGNDSGFEDVAPPPPSGPAPLAGVRFANWSPDAPAVDFCLAPHGSGAFRGPMMHAALAALDEAGVVDAAVPGLSFPQVGSYILMPLGQYDARLVAAGSPDCNVSVISPDDTKVAPLERETMTTIAAVGDVSPKAGAPGIGLVSFRDDVLAKLDGGQPVVSLRFIQAAPALSAASIGTGRIANGSFLQWFVGVPFGQASNEQEAQATETGTTPTTFVDPDGYDLLSTLSSATISVHEFKARADLVVARNVTAAPGTVLTMVLVGTPSSLQLLECIDDAGTVGLLSACQIVSE
jgi:hypothetical protein